MKAVGIRELKNRLSEYVRLVRSGERVLVTDRGEVVAELRPPGSPMESEAVHPTMEAVAKRGHVTIGGPNESDLYPQRPQLLPDGMTATLLEEERGDL
jgi:antitoxin (DNA-binding transcriptional repressor) of toxin-antitoxin stability system